MRNKVNELMEKFNCDGEVVYIGLFNSGHINTTCLVVVEDNGQQKKYVFQRINTNVFKNPEGVMKNISSVTGFIKDKIERQGEDSTRRVLNFKQAPDGNSFVIDDNGGYWRAYDFVDNSVTFDVADKDVMYETGKAFGEFQTLLSDFPSHELYDTIPDFHNTPKRFDTFRTVLANDPVNRANGVKSEIYQYLRLEQIACQMQNMLDRGELPLRVTHNDTKCNNVLFDEHTHKHLCVIDLDTVMPGLVGFDFGDAMRYASNTREEDCTQLDEIKVDLGKFEAFTRGFVESVGDALTEAEIKTLALGAITMTTECGLRFLTDYIDGDNYFKIDYPTHNLDRARSQLRLAQEMIADRQKLEKIVEDCVQQNKTRYTDRGDDESFM